MAIIEKNDQIDWGDDSPEPVVKSKAGEITPRHKMRFAGTILIASAIIFLLISAAEIFYSKQNPSVENVWKVTSYLVSSLVTLIIGFYFGDRSN